MHSLWRANSRMLKNILVGGMRYDNLSGALSREYAQDNSGMGVAPGTAEV